MSHLLLYLKSCVNYIHCKIFNTTVSCVFNHEVCFCYVLAQNERRKKREIVPTPGLFGLK